MQVKHKEYKGFNSVKFKFQFFQQLELCKKI
jgi:hypothetical protein